MSNLRMTSLTYKSWWVVVPQSLCVSECLLRGYYYEPYWKAILKRNHTSNKGLDSKMMSFTRTTSADFPLTAAMYCIINFAVSVWQVMTSVLRNGDDDDDVYVYLSSARLATNDYALILAFGQHETIHVVSHSVHVWLKFVSNRNQLLLLLLF